MRAHWIAAVTWAILATSRSAPDAQSARPRSIQGSGPMTACNRQRGRLAVSPSGPAMRFAKIPANVTSGDIRLNTGTHGSRALTVVHAAKVTARNGRVGTEPAIGARTRPMVMSPRVAAADNRNERSKAAQGSMTAPTMRLSARACTALTLRASRRPVYSAANIHAARQAEPLPPARSA